MQKRSSITESINIQGVTYRKRMKMCNTPNCKTCTKARSPEEAHGPYIEKGSREGKKMKWIHVRKDEVKNKCRPIKQIAHEILGVQTNLIGTIQKHNIKKMDEIIYSYSLEDAENDKLLFNICKINPKWGKGLFNYITINLLHKSYIQDTKIKVNNLLDLLNQSNQIVKKKSKNFTKPDTFFSGDIELPSGSQQKIFIVQNETQKFTIMLPEDY
ncbi:hypothetical protein [Candidatus Uabimicrobium sp. HlEnr_7]|uniref:hypothetical protein n=1 Tax=Candidatus Uabimicrobium helgolandensis TaxID=3095367 RepID=UPI003556CF09